jgi:hypothetical protein
MAAKVPPLVKGCDRCCETVQPNTGRHCPNCQMNFCERCCDQDNYIECECFTRGRPNKLSTWLCVTNKRSSKINDAALFINGITDWQNSRNSTGQYVTHQESQQRGEVHCHAMHWALLPDVVGREMIEVASESSSIAFRSGIASSPEPDSCDLPNCPC